MTQTDRLFEGARRLSVAITALWVIGCLVPVAISAKRNWDVHGEATKSYEAYWAFAKKETDAIGPWTVHRFLSSEKPSFENILGNEHQELEFYHPSGSLEADLKALRARSWGRFWNETESHFTFAIVGVLVIFGMTKTTGWVVRGFLGK